MLTAYQFASNMPICGNDLDGLELNQQILNEQKAMNAGQKIIKSAEIKAQQEKVIDALTNDAFSKLSEDEKKLDGAKNALRSEISQGITVIVVAKEGTYFNGEKYTQYSYFIAPSQANEKSTDKSAANEKKETTKQLQDITIAILQTASDILDTPSVPTSEEDIPGIIFEGFATAAGMASKWINTIGLVFTPTATGMGATPPPKIPEGFLKLRGKGEAYLKNLFNPEKPIQKSTQTYTVTPPSLKGS
jgi:hypothetical protein